MFNSIENTPSRIAKYIQTEIGEGRLKIGDKLPSERELVKKLGVSRSSIREAMKSLKTMGYVESIERKGNFISNRYIQNRYYNSQLNSILNRAPVIDLMEVRMFLEEKFISLAVERATKEDMEKLDKALEKMKTSSNYIDNFIQGDMEFHFALAKATHNVVIIELMKIIKSRMNDDRERFKAAGVETKEMTIKIFEKVIYYIKKKNIAEAEALYHEHLYQVNKFLKKSFE